MDLVFSARFDQSLRAAPEAVQRAFWKQAGFLLAGLDHPSLRAKKYQGATDVWQARVNRSWRFYCKIAGGAYCLVDIVMHPK